MAIIGVIPLAAASASASASPILAQASTGRARAGLQAPAFTLTNQHGLPVSRQPARKVVLTFLDPVHVDCPRSPR
jgi:hypothetical protein